MADIIKTEQLGSTVDSLTIAAGVYEKRNYGWCSCGELKKGIASSRNALELVPNDFGWFITTNLVVRLYKVGRLTKYINLSETTLRLKIWVAGYWLSKIMRFLSKIKGIWRAQKYILRTKKRGLNLVQLERILEKLF